MGVHTRHYGNIANNAYFNRRILIDFGIATASKITSGVQHALSAPAWEELDFEIPSESFIVKPDWRAIPGADKLNRASVASGWVKNPRLSRYVSNLRAIPGLHGTRLRTWLGSLVTKLEEIPQRVNKLNGKFTLSGTQQQTTSTVSNFQILYGPSQYMFQHEKDAFLIVFEHGTLRWIEKGHIRDARQREWFTEMVRSARHLLVTNLDSTSVEIASRLKPNQWTAFPHPYIFDENAPFSVDTTFADRLREDVSAENLVLLPSSLNWQPDHDKGSLKALEAFVLLRSSGQDVGLLLMRWGRQVQEARDFLEAAGVAQHTKWMNPMPRIPLQRLVACVDVVWDQFTYATFGALALRVLEQGTPLVSCTMDDTVGQLIGELPPILQASTPAEIADVTSQVFEKVKGQGLDSIHSESREKSRSWLRRRHSPQIAALLQLEVLHHATQSNHQGCLIPDRWAHLPDADSPQFEALLKDAKKRLLQ